MAKRATTWLRNETAVAEALGLALYDEKLRRAKRREQLEAVKAITAAPDFPPREPVKGAGRMWPRAASIAWGAANLELSQNRRTFSVLKSPKPKVQSPKPIGNLPGQENPAADGDLFGTLSPDQIERANRERLHRNLKVHLGLVPGEPLKKFEIEELVANKLLPKTALGDAGTVDNSDGVNVTGGVRGVAGYIFNNFQVKISHQSVHNWMTGITLPPGCKENFPGPEGGGSNRWKKREVDAWVIRWLKPAAVQGNSLVQIDDISRQQKAEADMAVMKAEQMSRSLSNKFLETEIVLGFVGGFGRWLGLQQDKFVEDKNGVRKIVAALLVEIFKPAPEQLTAFDTRLAELLAGANDAMKLATGHHAAELVRQLLDERAKDIKETMTA